MKESLVWCKNCEPSGLKCYSVKYNMEKRVVVIDNKERGLILGPIKECKTYKKEVEHERTLQQMLPV